MMTVPMDESPAPESWELAQRLYRKNIELENGLRRSQQSRVPSDPNAWVQMRENYEAIILEDHDFAEEHEIEYALWQLHYRRIEEFRAHINRSASAGGSVTSQGGKSLVRPDRIKKIRSVFKSFLSEATGFYHDLILKIRSKYGLPLAYISEAAETQIILVKDDNKSAELKKGILSCHRCLIYLGDLARYKGLYGEGDSSRDFAAASSYYVQAASLWPSSGNPHHQLAILASYSGEDLMTIYCYFRSLAVDNPFSTARDNLILAFEKNRQSYSQLPVNVKVPSSKPLASRTSGRGRGRGRVDTKLLAKDTKTEPAKEQEPSIPEIFKAFSIRFVRLSGILFTRTSLETFGEVLSLVIGNLHDLVSSGPEEELYFGHDAAENGLVIVRLITILVFSVHNVNRESEGQSYAEVLQRKVLLQNAFLAAFEFVGHLLKRCVELRDVASSYLLPGILVFMEWLACHQDFATRIDVDGKEAAMSFFWNQCISFMNKLMLSELAGIGDDEDIACFSDMSLYDEGETGNRLALWEDFELRGFSPLMSAHFILDFSRKHSLGNDMSNKEKQARIKRILAAGKALMQVVRINQQGVYYDSNLKKFVIGTKPPSYDHYVAAYVDASEPNDFKRTSPIGKMEKVQSKVNTEVAETDSQLFMEGEEEDEVIVFQPTVIEKYPNHSVSKSLVHESIPPEQNYLESESYINLLAAPVNDLKLPYALKATSQLPAPVSNVSPPTDNVNLLTSKMAAEQKSYFTNGLEILNIAEFMPNANPVMHEYFSGLQPTASNGLQHIRTSPLFSTSASVIPSGFVSYQNNVAETVIPSKLDSIVPDDVARKFSAPLVTTTRKNPVSRPVRHFGPPPGFDNAPVKRLDDAVSKSVELQPQMDDYSWLDGYQMPYAEGITTKNTITQSVNMYPQVSTSNSNAFNNAMTFPFPGKQVPPVQTDLTDVTKWQDFHLPNHMNSFPEQLPRAYQQSAPQPEQYQAQSLWSSHFFV